MRDERTTVFSTQVPALRVLEARIAWGQGRTAEARAVLDAALKDEGYPTGSTVRVPEMLSYAARIALDTGDIDTAIRVGRDAVRIAERELGTQSPSAYTGFARMTLGVALTSSDPRAARSELEQAVALLEAAAGTSHPWTDARSRLAALGQ